MRLQQGNGGPEERIEQTVHAYLRTGRVPDLSAPELTTAAERLLQQALREPRDSPARRRAFQLTAWLYLTGHRVLAQRAELPDFDTTVELVGLLHDMGGPDVMPGRLWQMAVEFGADPETRVRMAVSFLDLVKHEGQDPLTGILTLQNALSDLPDDHAHMAPFRLLVATSWVERYEKFGDPGDLDRAHAAGRVALRLCPAESPARRPILHALAVIMNRLVAREPTAENVRFAVEVYRKFLAIAPPESEEHRQVRFSLGELLKFRFDHTRSPADLDEAVAVLHEGVEDAARSGVLRADHLCSLADAYRRRGAHTRVRDDIDEAIRLMQAAVYHEPARAAELLQEVRALERERAVGAWTERGPEPTPPSPHARAEEGRSLIERSQADDDALARDRGIELLGSAVNDLPADFPDLPPYLAILGRALLDRYNHGSADPVDLGAAEEMIQRAVRLCPEGHSNMIPFLVILTMVADARYRRSGTPEDAETVIDTCRRLLTLPISIPQQLFGVLQTLGRYLAERFERTAEPFDLDEAIDVLRRCLAASLIAEADSGLAALDLAQTLIRRYEHTPTWDDLDEAHGHLQTALDDLPDGHAGRERAAALLAEVERRREEYRARHEERLVPYMRQWKHVGGPADRPAASPEEAADDPAAPYLYANVLTGHLQRFDRTGDVSEVEAGLDLGRRLLSGMASGHPARSVLLGPFATLLLRRYEERGDPRDLDAAVEHLRECAYGPHPVIQQMRKELNRPDASIEELRQAGDGVLDELLELTFDRGAELTALAAACLRRFERDRDSGDLDEAVDAARRAVEATPSRDSLERSSRLMVLGTALVRRHEHTGDRTDLDWAIHVGREVVADVSLPVSVRRKALGNLCNRLRTRYLLTGDAADLDEAVRAGERAVTVDSHPIHRTNLALALWDRARLTGNLADLDTAIGHVEAVAGALDPSSPERAGTLGVLGRMLHTRAAIGGEDDADRCLELLREAALAAASPPHERLAAAVARGEFAAERGDWAAATDGFATAVELLPLTAWRGLARTDRERLLARHAGLAADAAACAISCGRPEKAVELLDQGRSVLWSQLLDTRTDLTALRGSHPETAARMDELRAELDTAAPADPVTRAGRRRHERLRRSAREWEELLGEIRRRPGFEHFLLPLPFGVLSEATTGGTMIIVNVSRYRCDALLVTPGRVRLVPLPGLTAREAQMRAERYLAALDRPGTPTGPAQQTVMDTLEWLWDVVAGPILDSDEAAGLRGGRVWWCPTGPLALLPVHAAGYHDPDDGRMHDAVLDRVISSYTPTLRSLLHARHRVPPGRARRLLVLAVGDRPDYAPHLAPLPGALAEARSLCDRFPGEHSALFDAEATCERALDLLATHSHVHFACHAGQNLADPSQGALYLHDRPLTVAELARLDLASAELAVLSACQTALGGADLPDEAIHVAAALQLANIRHVVATLWTVGDETARHIMDDFYRALCGEDGRLDAASAAQALHEAVDRARRREPDRPVNWASYVHFGP